MEKSLNSGLPPNRDICLTTSQAATQTSRQDAAPADAPFFDSCDLDRPASRASLVIEVVAVLLVVALFLVLALLPL